MRGTIRVMLESTSFSKAAHPVPLEQIGRAPARAAPALRGAVLLLVFVVSAGAFVGPASAGPPAAAREAKAEGDRLAGEGELEGAVDAYLRALEIEPEYALARNELGTALFRLGRLEEAMDEFEHAVRLDEDYATAWFNLAFASRRLESWERSAAAYERYTELRPDEPDAWYGLGLSLVELDRLLEAADALEAYSERESRPAREERAREARERAGELRRAAADAERAPEDSSPEVVADPTEGLEEAVVEESAPEPPIEDALDHEHDHGAEISSGVSEHVRSGDLHLDSGEPSLAAASFRAALDLDPDNVEAIYKLAFAHARKGRHEKAIAGWERVLEIEPDNYGARRNIEVTRAGLEDEPRAEPSLDATPQARVEPEPPSPTDRAAARQAYQRAIGSMGERRFEEALEELSEALRLDDGLVQAHVAKGSAFFALRRYDEARISYEAALEDASGMAAPLYGLGETYRALGDLERARHFYERYVHSEAGDVDEVLKERASRWLESNQRP